MVIHFSIVISSEANTRYCKARPPLGSPKHPTGLNPFTDPLGTELVPEVMVVDVVDDVDVVDFVDEEDEVDVVDVVDVEVVDVVIGLTVVVLVVEVIEIGLFVMG